METIKRTKIVDVLKSDAFGTTVNVKGWVRTRRGSKQVNFIALNDGSTINNVQIVVDVDKLGEEFLKPITTGASISVNGTLVQSQGKGQNVEIQAVYEKYGTSMTGGCLPLLIQMPILLALYRVIYNAIEDVEAAMKGMLDPVFEEKVLGHAEVRQTFKASGVGTIAGSYVLDGVFERDCSVRLTRDGIVIFEGPLASLKRFKDDVKEVKAGYECGFVFANFNDIKEGDLVEAFKMVEIPR